MSGLSGFVWKYLVGPIVADGKNAESLVWQGVTTYPGYNLVNTVTYGLIALTGLYFSYRFFKMKDIELSPGLAIKSVPYMFLGGALRFMEDAQVVSFPYNIVLITPFVYMLVALIYIPAVSYLGRKHFAYLGSVLLIPPLALSFPLFQPSQSFYFASVVILSGLLTGLYIWLVNESLKAPSYVLVAASQFFEGAASMMASFQGYQPKQLLAQTLNRFMGPPGILVLKLGVLALALSVLTDLEDEKMKGLALLVLYAIGFGTGFRVFLRALSGI
jgi:uncharacterized membrane protein